MKSNSPLALFIIYLIPYAFLALLGDFAVGIMWGYLVMAVVLVIADIWRTHKYGGLWAVLGNILSGGVSYRACVASGLNRRTWFFKPFTPRVLVVLITVVSILVRLMLTKIVKQPKDQ